MSEVEAKAKAQGWVPKEDYNGDPENWKPAEEFLAVGEKIAAVQSERNNKLMEEIKGLKSSLDTVTNDFKEFQSQQFKVVHEAREEGYQKAKKKFQEKKRAAVEDGDLDLYDKLDKEEKALKKPEAPKKQPEKQEVTPEFMAWANDNDWYLKDKDLRVAADVYFENIKGEISQNTPTTDVLNKIGGYIKKIFPDKFETQKAPDLDEGKPPKKQSGNKTYSDLPKEAKKACDAQVARGLCKKEDYVKHYFDQE